jgi:hypothetical protein
VPEPSFDGRRRCGVLAAGAAGGLTLLLTAVIPALAAGPFALLLGAAGHAVAGAVTVRSPARALRSTLEARA